MNITDNNFCLLINRKQGEIFDLMDGKLISLSIFQKIRYIFQKSYRQAIQERLKPVVSRLVSRITDEKQLQSLKRLPISIFNRTALSSNFLTSIRPALSKQTDRKEMNEMIQRIQLAFKLGIRPQVTGEGTSGSYFLKDITGKKLGIFKPSDEEVLSVNSSKLSNKIKRFFYRRFPFISPTSVACMSGVGYKSEEAASRISELLNLPTVPLTRIASFSHPDFYYSSEDKKNEKLPEKEGSLQTFVNQSQTAEVALGIGNLTRFFPNTLKWILAGPTWLDFLNSKFSQEEFERFVVIDFLVGNLDRHFGNWMLCGKEIKAIDNGYAMPHKHTESRRCNQYLWKTLPQATRPFGKAAKSIIKRLGTQHLPQKLSDLGLIKKEQRKCFEERIAVLTHFVTSGKTPYELAKMIKPIDFQRPLPSISSSP